MPTGVPGFAEGIAKRVTESSPVLKRTADRVYRRYLKLYLTYLESRYCVEEYRAPIDRTELLWVDPNRITYAHSPGFAVRKDDICEVIGGNWDEGLPTFEEIFPYDSFEAHFLDGVPWEDTEMYEFVRGIIESGRSWREHRSWEAAKNNLGEIDQLFEWIKQEGYKTQRELCNNSEKVSFTKSPEMDEIMVDIGRDGEIIFEDGRHRLAIAKVLRLEQIPVRVLVRHSEWQQIRDQYVGDPPTQPPSHPDLANIAKMNN